MRLRMLSGLRRAMIFSPCVQAFLKIMLCNRSERVWLLKWQRLRSSWHGTRVADAATVA